MDWELIERRALAVGAAGIVVCVAAAIFSWQHFLRAYLVAWNFWAGVSLGSLALLMIQYVTGGAWGLLLRRFFEAAAGNILLLALLFLVLLPGLPALYDWARPEAVAASPVLQHKSAYLNPHCFPDSGRDLLCVVGRNCLAAELLVAKARSRSAHGFSLRALPKH